MATLREWLAMATRRPVVLRALKFMVVVGCILAAINHGDAILAGKVDGPRLRRILLTFAVPYIVSTFSSVAAMRQLAQEKETGERENKAAAGH